MDQDTQSRVQTICLMIIAAAVIAAVIYWLRPVLVPLVVAVIVVSGVSPILDSLQRRLKVKRLVAAGITFIAGLLIMLVLGWSLWSSTLELTANEPAYRERFQSAVDLLEQTLAKFPYLAGTREALAPAPDAADAPTIGPPDARQRPVKARALLDSLVKTGFDKVSAALIDLSSASVVVLIYVFFLLLGAPKPSAPDSAWGNIEQQIRSYLALKTIISILTGVAFGVAIALFGLPMAMTFGVLAFLLNFIPNIGPLVACVLPIPLIVLQPDASLLWMSSAILVTTGIQVISGNLIEPKVMGESSNLHPVVVLVALMFWGMMWGIVGMFLATPITAGVKILLERIDATKPIAEALSGRIPALTEQTARGSS